MNENDPYYRDPRESQEKEPKFHISDSEPASQYSPYGPQYGLPQDQQIYQAEYVSPQFSEKNFLEDQEPYDGSTGNWIATFFAWLVILAITTFLVATNFIGQYFSTSQSTAASKGELMQLNFQSKILVGMPKFLESLGARGQNDVSKSDIQALNQGPLESRFAYTILASETLGPEFALSELMKIRNQAARAALKTGAPQGWPEVAFNKLDTDDPEQKEPEHPDGVFHITQKQAQLADILERLFESLLANDVDAFDNLAIKHRDLLSNELGWLGLLAVAPENAGDPFLRSDVIDEAKSTVSSAVYFGIIIFIGALAASAVALGMVLLLAFGKLNFGFRTSANRGGIYAETFAFWMVLFVLGSLALGIAQSALGLSPVATIFAQLIVFFGSLFALTYPLIRGVPLDRLLADIGWQLKNPLVESFMGFVGYLAIFPLIAAGFVGTIVVTLISVEFLPEPIHEFVSNNAGAHPIADEIASGNSMMILGVFLTACVAAPIVEETVFRGLLYQHLRDSTKRWGGQFVSVLFSALLSSFIFAVIHPQGLVGVPVLTLLAVGFALIREWRGSVIAPMVMHFIHNSIVTFVLVLIM